MAIRIHMLQSSLRRLEVFVTAAECGSFAAASERLNIAQPSVSAHIAALEKAVGGQLFTRRRGSRPVLTDLGQSVLAHAREMLDAARDLSLDALKIHSGGGQSVIFSCQRALANFALNQALTTFALDHSDIQLTVRIGRQEEVLADMRGGRSDFGCFLSNTEFRGLSSIVVGRQEFQFAASPEHPLASQKSIPPDVIAKQAFVGPPPESLFGRAIARQMQAAGIQRVKTVAQATESYFLRQLVIARVGIACSAEVSVRSDVEAGRLVLLDADVPPITLDIRLLTTKNRRKTKTMQIFSEFLQSALQPFAS